MRISVNFFTLPFMFLTACAVAPVDAPSFSKTPVPEAREGKAVLYIYRQDVKPTAWATTVYVDDKKVVSLPQHSFSWIYLPAGKHTISYRWPIMAGMPSSGASGEYLAGGRYFYEINTKLDVTGVSNFGFGFVPNFDVGAKVSSQVEEKAIKQLEECCRYIQPALPEL